MTKNTHNTGRNADTSAVAIGYTNRQEGAAMQACTAWAVHLMDRVLGWNSQPIKVGKGKSPVDVAAKVTLETYGHHKNDDGTPRFNADGNKAKRSSVYAAMTQAKRIVTYARKNQPEWITTIHDAATNPEATPEERDAAVSEQIESFAAALVTLAGGSTLDDLRDFLDGEAGKTRKAKEAAKAAKDGTDAPASDDPLAGLDGDAPDADNAANKTKGFDAALKAIAKYQGHLDATQVKALAEIVDTERKRLEAEAIARVEAAQAKAA